MLILRLRFVKPLVAGLFLMLLALTPVRAQPQDADQGTTYARQASELKEQVEDYLQQVSQYEGQLARHDGLAAQVLQERMDNATLEALEQAHQLAQLVIEREAAGENPGPFGEQVRDMLQTIPERLGERARKLLEYGISAQDISELDATEQIELEARQQRRVTRALALYEVLQHNVELSGELGLQTAEQVQMLSQAVTDAAVGQSIELELALDSGEVLARQVKALPDEAELAALAKVNDSRIARLRDTLHQLVEIMEQRDLPVADYRQQLVAVAGTVTADILDLQVMRELAGNWLEDTWAWTQQNLPEILFNVLLFLLILWGAALLAGLARGVVDRALMKRSSNRLSELARRMLVATAGNLVLVLGFLFGLAQLGVSIGPLLAGLGIAGFIVGFALQDTLGNFASGMLILLYRPYDVGDFVETNGVFGKVSSMSFVNTTVLTIDNQTLVLPNSKIWGDVLKNVTAQRERRVDMVFGIGYADDIGKAETVLNEIVHEHDKILDEPEPVVRLHTLNESSVDFVVRPWVKTEDYWEVYWDITRAVKMRFDEQGITIPFPQRDVHLFTNANAATSSEPNS